MESAAPNTAPQVSVIMPAYMTAHLIAGALDSVLDQSFRNFEIVVVNDGSPDTAELENVLTPYRDKIVYLKQENKRAAGARNNAIGHAKGEFLAFLDSDDAWFPGHLAAQMKLFERDPALDLVYCDGVMETPESSHKFMDRCPSQGPATFEALVVERCQIPVSTVVARKVALARACFFDETLPRCDDYDMWLRAAFWGAKIGYSCNVQARFSVNRPGALSASNLNMVEAYWRILEKAAETLPLNNEQKSIVQQRASKIRAHYLLEEGKTRLDEGRVSEAVTSFSEANTHLQSAKLSLILFGLKTAPAATSKLVAFAKRIRGVAVH